MTTNKRTIYRGKTIKTDTWVYGNVLYNNKGEALITNSDCAGSGKTTHIVDEAMKVNGNVLITTFTDNNTDEILNKFIKKYGYKPANITILPWFSFQLEHLISPFQLSFIDVRIKDIIMQNGKNFNRYKSDQKGYYLCGEAIYSDKIAFLAFKTLNTNELTYNRLKCIFDYIFIDEFQDFSGYDLEIVKHLANKGMNIEIVCDPYIVDGGTVGQYIGLNDSLDTPIFDGDIVMLTTKTTIDKATVVWDGIKAGYFYLVIDKTGGWAINPDKFIKWNAFGNTIEVVGNIHEEE